MSTVVKMMGHLARVQKMNNINKKRNQLGIRKFLSSKMNIEKLNRENKYMKN